MLELAVQLTLESTAAEMSPTEFLVSLDLLEEVKREALLPKITSGQAKHLRLEPEATGDDKTMTHYQQRVKNTSGRSDVMVMLPFKQAWEGIRQRIGVLEEEVRVLRHQDVLQSKQLDQQSQQFAQQMTLQSQQFAQQLALQSQEFAQQLAQQSEQQSSSREEFFVGNTLVHLARFLSKKLKLGDSESSTNRLQKLAFSVTEKQLAENKVPSKYLKVIQKLPEWIDLRNRIAHESEVKFAKHLVSQKGSFKYEFWKDIFPLLYDGSVEDVAAREDNQYGMAGVYN